MPRYGVVWRKPPNAAISVRAPKVGFFYLLLNDSFMYSSIDLSPVKELLTDVVSHEHLAQIVDDIFYDYVDALFTVLLVPNHKFVLDNELLDRLWYLRKIRDTFRACEEIK